MTRRAALFDLDGVLMDSAGSILAAMAAVATCATGRRWTAADLPPGSLLRPREQVLDSLGVADPDDACTRWWDGALAAHLPQPFPGVLPGLLALREAGTAVAVVTLQDRSRLHWLLPPELADLLDAVVTRQDAPAKPAPGGLRLALERVGVPAGRAVFLGDSPTDMTAAIAADVLALAAGWGWHPTAALRAAGAHHVIPGPTGIGLSLLDHLPLTQPR